MQKYLSMSYKISGVVFRIGSIEEKGNFKTGTFSIDTGGEYPQKVQFQVNNQMCDVLSRLTVGQYITLHFSLRGREWNDKVITNLHCYKVEGIDVGTSPQSGGTSPQQSQSTSPQNDQAAPVNDQDDLPF